MKVWSNYLYYRDRECIHALTVNAKININFRNHNNTNNLFNKIIMLNIYIYIDI